MDGLNVPEYCHTGPVVQEIEVETTERDDNGKSRAKGKVKIERPFFEPNDYRNGALLEAANYCWSQTLKEIGMN